MRPRVKKHISKVQTEIKPWSRERRARERQTGKKHKVDRGRVEMQKGQVTTGDRSQQR